MSQRLLTKSRFKLALNVLISFIIPERMSMPISNWKILFWRLWLQGGFQVEELARLEYPEGILDRK